MLGGRDFRDEHLPVLDSNLDQRGRLLGRTAANRTRAAIESRAVPGTLQRAVLEDFTHRQLHPLVRTLVEEGRDLVTTPDETDRRPVAKRHGQGPLVRNVG
jgi:hypothetical protein